MVQLDEHLFGELDTHYRYLPVTAHQVTVVTLVVSKVESVATDLNADTSASRA